MLHWGKCCGSIAFVCPSEYVDPVADLCNGWLLAGIVCVVRDLLDHPKISPLLEDLLGDPGLAKDGLPSFRIDHICTNVSQCR